MIGMKKSILYIAVASMMVLAGCNDMLDKTPRDTFTNGPQFWSNPNNVTSYCNKFYANYIGYSDGGSYGWFYFKSLSDDQVQSTFQNWTYTTIPSTATEWTNGFKEVRRINYMIQGVAASNLTASQKSLYTAIGRLNRAWQYYQLVRQYGDVEWLSEVILDPEDGRVYGERTDRDVVMDSVLNDLDYAIGNLTDVSDKTAWSKQMAQAMKSDICLYEGTFCKYRTLADNGKAADATRATRYLTESLAASEALITSGKFSLSEKYGNIYNSLALGTNSEIIFYRNYEKDLLMHGLVDYTSSSTEQWGITKDAFDAFLFTDGLPLSTTTLDTDDKAVLNEDGDYSVAQALARRDKRLSVLVDSIICFKGHGWSRLDEDGNYTGHAEMTSSTGYTIKKFDNTSLALYYRANTNTGYTDAPLYWYAVILLNKAEAKAELGTITQTDLDETINLLQARAGLPDMTLQPTADPANNMSVSNLIWEIRRVRRCELMLDNWYRYWDLVRWHQLDKLDGSIYPNINRGANLTNVVDNPMTVDANNYIIPTSSTRTYAAKYYLYPIPTNELNLNPKNLTQNLNW